MAGQQLAGNLTQRRPSVRPTVDEKGDARAEYFFLKGGGDTGVSHVGPTSTKAPARDMRRTGAVQLVPARRGRERRHQWTKECGARCFRWAFQRHDGAAGAA